MKLFDLHCDTLGNICDNQLELKKNPGHIDLVRAGEMQQYIQVFAIWGGNDQISGHDARNRFDNILNYAQGQFLKNSENIYLATDQNQMRSALVLGENIAFLSVEGAELIESYDDLLQISQKGVKIITLTWNFENAFGYPACKENLGLKPKGRELVEKMQKNDIIVDVSHISEVGFFDVYEICKKPFIASHSNSRAICEHKRNLTDEQFLCIKERGGLVGINLYSGFVTEKVQCSIDDVIRHIEHFMELSGQKNVAIGCDFDGCDRLPKGINGIEDIFKLYERLLMLNYKEDLVRDIFWNNAQRVIIKGEH